MATGSGADLSFAQTILTAYPDESPSKRPKTLTLASSPSPSSSSSKGKTKIETEDESSESDCCGICLLEEGGASRGWIDSCDHYFCFVCIMEWAKVESRCPLCKRRFSTIRRPPKPGLCSCERFVNVPQRDQVYDGLGNATIGPSTPFMEVQCTVCHGASDESLLLLCDLCDSAAHTYCIGLGATVPEGDWFCHDCTLLRDEHTKSESDQNCDCQTSFDNSNKVRLVEEHVSIRDIIGESGVYGHERPSIAMCSTRSRLPSSVIPDAGNTSTELGARTLRHCRNVQVRVQALRENWNGFRSGSLRFSSSSTIKSDSVIRGRSNQQKSSSFSTQQATSQEDFGGNILPNRGSYDVDKAWKMMNAAKAIAGNHRRAVSKNPVKKVTTGIEAGKSSVKLNTSNSKLLGNTDNEVCGLAKNYKFLCQKRDDHDDDYKYQMFEKAKQEVATVKSNKKSLVAVPTISPGFQRFPSSRMVQMSAQVDNFHENHWNRPQEPGATNVLSTPEEKSLLKASKVSCAELELHASSSCNSQKGMVKCLGNSKTVKADEAKTEIQSLVKLNLKILTRDDKLEVDAFKEVARHATHSILAACGLERPKVGICSFPSLVCRHNDEVQQFHRSTLMPTSCRECFFAFVKDVVSTIVFDRKGYVKV